MGRMITLFRPRTGTTASMIILLLLEVIPAQSAYHYRLTLLYPLLSSTVPTPPIHTLVRLYPSSLLTFPPLLSSLPPSPSLSA